MLAVKRQEAFNQFRYLWRLDDKEWVKERKQQWKCLAEHNFSRDSTSEQKKYMRYFVKAEWDSYIGESIPLLLTPYDSAESVKEIFNSQIFTADDRRQIMSRYIFAARKFGQGMLWLRQHIQWFVDGVLGHEYRLIEEQGNVVKRIVSPEPGFWCRQYTSMATALLKREFDYHAVADCLSYYISALLYVTESSDRQYIQIDELIRLADQVSEDRDVSGPANELARGIKLRKQEIIDNWIKNSHSDNENNFSD